MADKNKPKKKKGNQDWEWEFFDDCAICQAMKEGKASTLEELQEAFRKANEKNQPRPKRIIKV